MSFDVMAQTLGENQTTNTITLGMDPVALLGNNGKNVNLTLTPRNAGESVLPSIADSTARIYITSVISGEATRTMSANVTGTIPSGTILKLVAQEPNGSFVGTAGTMENEIQLIDGAAALPIITGIGTCYSGTGEFDGYALKYTYGLPSGTADYASIRANAGSVVTVTLTLSQ